MHAEFFFSFTELHMANHLHSVSIWQKHELQRAKQERKRLNIQLFSHSLKAEQYEEVGVINIFFTQLL